MLKILNKNQIQNLEENACSGTRVLTRSSLYELMANSFCSKFVREFNDNRTIIVFAGPNANGAIALAIARVLLSLNRTVVSFLLNPNGELSDEVKINRQKIKNCNGELHEISNSFHPPRLTSSDLVIDGIYGIELCVPIDDDMGQIVKYLNKSEAKIVSVDLPSGLFPEDNSANQMNHVIQADYTFTFHAAKLALLLGDNDHYVGKWQIIDCGLEKENPQKNVRYLIFSMSDIEDHLSVRPTFSDKRDNGYVALIAGSKNMMGAALLAGKACMRTGAGLLTMHVPAGKDDLVHMALPEALVETDVSDRHFTLVSDLEKYDAIAVGPGLGRDPETKKALKQLFENCHNPMVIDADAINILAEDISLQEMLPKNSILTPHKRELDRLVGTCKTDFERLEKAASFAQKHSVFVLLKGAYTATCLPTGAIIFNQTGNPGMATAGAGDVLTGMILSLLGQGYDSLTSSVFAVFMHGYAGDRYAEAYSQESLLASDIIDYIPMVYKHFRKNSRMYML